MIPVTKPYLPSREKLDKYIDGIYEREWLTNNGPLVQELTKRLEEYLGVENLLLVSNGTLALQIAYRALGIHEPVNGKPAEAITTPFSFVATSSSLKWEGIEPVFADIEPETWCLNPDNIGPTITPQTKAIVPVHVFGNACQVEVIDEIAKRNNLKVIYDAAHAFGVEHNGKSILKWGDAATLSFHATKVFHTIEGGAIIFKRKEDFETAKKLISFGLNGPETIQQLGINAKMNEFQAAMGLCNLDEIDSNLKRRRAIWDRYYVAFSESCELQVLNNITAFNYSYFPLLIPSGLDASQLVKELASKNVSLRRYFSPSLNLVDCLGSNDRMSISELVASKIVCIPIYADLDKHNQIFIINKIQEILERK